MGIDVIRNLNRVINQMNVKVERAVAECGEDLLRKSNEVCPMSPLGSATSGDLRKSGTVSVEKNGLKTVAKVGYGGGQVDYAIAVHEMPESYNFTQPGTGPKYLENPLKENSKKYIDKVAKAAKV